MLNIKMLNINSRYIVKRQTKEIKVYLPEQCPFRYTAFHNVTSDEEDYCGYLKSLHKTVDVLFVIEEHKFASTEDANATCCCTDDQWIEGCPLLKDD